MRANGVAVRPLNVRPHPPVPLHTEKTRPSTGIDAVPMRASESAMGTDSAGVPVSGVVRNRRVTGLGLPLRLHLTLDIRELVGAQFVQQRKDELVDIAVDHYSNDWNCTL